MTNYTSSWVYDNIGPMIKALSMIYIGTFFVFVGIEAQIIQVNYEIPKLVPIITVVLFGSIPLYYDDLTRYIEQNMVHGLDLDMSKLSASKFFIGCFVIIIVVALTPGNFVWLANLVFGINSFDLLSIYCRDLVGIFSRFFTVNYCSYVLQLFQFIVCKERTC